VTYFRNCDILVQRIQKYLNISYLGMIFEKIEIIIYLSSTCVTT